MENIFGHYAGTEKLYMSMVNPVCEKHGLTYMEFTVIMFLSNNPRFDTASDIVKYRHLTKSHVSMSVRSLEDKGLLKGEHHEPNRRSIHLTVLPAAEAIVADGREAQQKLFAILFDGFSPAEHDQMYAFFARIEKNIADHVKQIQAR